MVCGSWFVVRCVLFEVCCLLCVVLFRVVCCLLVVVCWLLLVARCGLFVVIGLFFVD